MVLIACQSTSVYPISAVPQVCLVDFLLQESLVKRQLTVGNLDGTFFYSAGRRIADSVDTKKLLHLPHVVSRIMSPLSRGNYPAESAIFAGATQFRGSWKAYSDG